MRKLWGVPALVALVVTSVLPFPASGTSETPSVRVSVNRRLGADLRPARGRDAPGMAADPADPRHVVLTDFDYVDSYCGYQVTFDAGATWQGGNLPAPTGYPERSCRVNNNQVGGRPAHGAIAFGSEGDVYAAYSSELADGSDSIVVTRSSDGGRTFTMATVAMQADRARMVDYRRPKVAVDRRPEGDRVYVFGWECSLSEPRVTLGFCYSVAFAASADRGQTFSSPVRVNGAPLADLPSLAVQDYDNSQPAVLADGTVAVVYRRVVALTQNSLMLGISRDGGATWTRHTAVPSLIPARGFVDPKLVADPRDDRLHLTYEARPADGVPADVFAVRSHDGGATWSPPVRVNDDAGTADQLNPWIAVAPDGRVDVTWFDRRHDYPGGNLEDVYYAFSTDGGASFSRNRRITDRTSSRVVGFKPRMGTFSAASAPVEGGLLVAWADTREGTVHDDNQDIYWARVDVEASGPLPVRTMPAHAGGTGVAASRFVYPGLERTPGGAATTVVVVNEHDSAAAIAGSVLARFGYGPLLASPAAGLPAAAGDEVGRLSAVAAYVVGNETALSPQVVADLARAGVPAGRITRIAGSDPADTARRIALAVYDTRSQAERLAGVPPPSPGTAVIVNASTRESAAVSALAAALKLPVLLVDATSVPAATAEALGDLRITRTLVVGGPAAISDGVLAVLPSPTRLGGADAYRVSEAVALEQIARRMPHSVAYVVDGDRPLDVASLGAVVARAGGLLMMVPGADAGLAEARLDALGIRGSVDYLVLAPGS